MKPATDAVTRGVIIASGILLAAAFALAAALPARDHRTLPSGVVMEIMTFAGRSYLVATVDLSRAELALYWNRPDGTRYGSFRALADDLAARGRPLVFATNAGIFDPSFTPLGLHVEGGREGVPLNRATGRGNFFLKPNGVFLVDDRGARILDAAAYERATPATRLATQSGPLLLLAGRIHPRFAADSPNRRLRSGVGVRPPGRVVFVLSREPVTFHELAALFRDRLGCADALYLDGEISRFYVPPGPAEGAAAEYAGMLAATSRR